MKILSQEQIYEADRQTLSREGISSEMLMERAATRVFEWIHDRARRWLWLRGSWHRRRREPW